MNEFLIDDIIDNSIYAQASNIYLEFEFDGADSVIKIINDGKALH